MSECSPVTSDMGAGVLIIARCKSEIVLLQLADRQTDGPKSELCNNCA